MIRDNNMMNFVIILLSCSIGANSSMSLEVPIVGNFNLSLCSFFFSEILRASLTLCHSAPDNLPLNHIDHIDHNKRDNTHTLTNYINVNVCRSV